MKQTLCINDTSWMQLGMIITSYSEGEAKSCMIVGIKSSTCIDIIPYTIKTKIWYFLKTTFYSVLAFPYFFINAEKANEWTDKKIYGG